MVIIISGWLPNQAIFLFLPKLDDFAGGETLVNILSFLKIIPRLEAEYAHFQCTP